MNEPTAYLWRADQTEPGLSGFILEATNTPEPPSDVQPARQGGLTLSDSLYGDWELLGTVKGRAVRTVLGGTVIEMDTPRMRGAALMLDDVYRSGWYTQAGG